MFARFKQNLRACSKQLDVTLHFSDFSSERFKQLGVILHFSDLSSERFKQLVTLHFSDMSSERFKQLGVTLHFSESTESCVTFLDLYVQYKYSRYTEFSCSTQQDRITLPKASSSGFASRFST